MSLRLAYGLLTYFAVSVAKAADQAPLGNSREGCPDYVSYSSSPQSVLPDGCNTLPTLTLTVAVR